MMMRIFECRNRFTVGINTDSNSDNADEADISMI